MSESIVCRVFKLDRPRESRRYHSWVHAEMWYRWLRISGHPYAVTDAAGHIIEEWMP